MTGAPGAAPRLAPCRGLPFPPLPAGLPACRDGCLHPQHPALLPAPGPFRQAPRQPQGACFPLHPKTVSPSTPTARPCPPPRVPVPTPGSAPTRSVPMGHILLKEVLCMGWRRGGAAMGWESRGVWWLPQACVGLRGWGDGGSALTLSLLLFCKRSGGRAVTPLAGRGRWQRNPRALRSSHTPAAPADVCSAPEPGEPASTSLPAPQAFTPCPAAQMQHPTSGSPHPQRSKLQRPAWSRAAARAPAAGSGSGRGAACRGAADLPQGWIPRDGAHAFKPQHGFVQAELLQPASESLHRPNAKFGARQAGWAVRAPRGSEVSAPTHRAPWGLGPFLSTSSVLSRTF